MKFLKKSIRKSTVFGSRKMWLINLFINRTNLRGKNNEATDLD